MEALLLYSEVGGELTGQHDNEGYLLIGTQFHKGRFSQLAGKPAVFKAM